MGLMRVVRNMWCDWTHGGGRIKRDPYKRVNWQCDKCGRWAEPVDLQVERMIVERDIREHGSK